MMIINSTNPNYIGGFDWSDYTVFGLMLGVSALIGVYFGCFGSKQKSANDYLLGGQNLNPIPVALSLVASYVSGTTLIAVPSEVYTDNPSYWLSIVSTFFGCIIAYYFYIPIFYELKVNTAYEYLEYRFDRRVRTIASFLYCSAYLLYLPIVIYIPSLALSLVTGWNLHIITVGVTAICIFYTMIGGLKAVVWTDFFQMAVTLLACIAIIIIGTIDAGGFTHVMKTAYDDGKLNIFNMDPNPFERTTFWTMFIGGLVSSIVGMGTSQMTIQRYISMGSSDNLVMVLVIFNVGILFLSTMCIYGGLVIYTVYYGCDPIKNKIISQPDQIFPYYILDKIAYVPVLPGLFVAGVFGAALSSLSTGYNTITGIIYNDYLKTRIKQQKHEHIYMKIITLFIGIFSIVMVFLVERMGKILSTTYIITSITYAPVCVLFTLGLFVPTCNTKGAIASVISSAAFLLWIAIGSTIYSVNFISQEIYPNDTCPIGNNSMEFNSTIIKTHQDEDDIFPLYKLSYMFYNPFGIGIGFIFGIITSYLTGPQDPAELDPRLISPPLRRFLPKKKENQMQLDKLMPIKI